MKGALVKQKRDQLAHRGLTLRRNVLRRLDRVGILAESHVSLEHQHLAGRYVVRGIESGGAVREMGRYITFCAPDGMPLSYLHPIDAIGVNGVHAVVVAPVLVRIELFRSGRTCQLLITRHEPARAESGRRPLLENSVLFLGVNGFLNKDAPDSLDRETVLPLPRFWTRGGEPREIPLLFVAAVQAATVGACCVGCSHTHFLAPPPTMTFGAGGDD